MAIQFRNGFSNFENVIQFWIGDTNFEMVISIYNKIYKIEYQFLGNFEF